MKRFIRILVIVFSTLTLLLGSYLGIDYQRVKYLLIISLFILVICYVIIAIKQKYSLKRIIISVLIFLLLSILAFFTGIFVYVKTKKACPSKQPVTWEAWKNVKQINLEEIADQVFLYKDKFDISVKSQIFYQKDTFNIYSIKINPERENKILILSGIHGSEPAGVMAIPEIINEIANNIDLYKSWNIEIVYPLNPVGLSFFSRINECGCDINRDFKKFKTKQSRLIKELFEKNKYELVLDFHEGPYNGHAIVSNNVADKFLLKFLDGCMQKNNIKQSPITIESGNSFKNFLSFYKNSNIFSKYGEIKVIGELAQDFGLQYIASESDAFSSDIEMRIKSHLLMFKETMNYLNNKKNDNNNIKL
jgi:energy-coupling factor transporter transmembrane protein EcfT